MWHMPIVKPHYGDTDFSKLVNLCPLKTFSLILQSRRLKSQIFVNHDNTHGDTDFGKSVNYWNLLEVYLNFFCLFAFWKSKNTPQT